MTTSVSTWLYKPWGDSPAFDFNDYSAACISVIGEPMCTFWSCVFDKRHWVHENAVLVNLVIVG